MKDQINTIREALEGFILPKAVHEALCQIEQMAEALEPVSGVVLRDNWPTLLLDRDIKPTDERLYRAAPPARQYEAGDMADAQAKAFRAGVASVQQGEPVHQFRNPHCSDWYDGVPDHHDGHGPYEVRTLYTAAPVAQQPTFDARRALEAIEALLSNIRRDAPSLSGKVMGFAEEVAAALRDKVARQPQARPDFTDEWAGYLKDGETPFERFLRERKDLNALTKLYQRALEENERLKAQQPQAEAVPGLGEFLADLNRSRTKYPNNARMWDGLMGEVNELRRAYHGDGDQRAEAFDVAVCAYRIATEGDAGGNTLFAAPQQAEAVPKFVWGYAVRNPKEPGVPHSLAYSKVQADTQALQLYRAEIIPLVAAAPQQAEAAPSDVARDAERLDWLLGKGRRMAIDSFGGQYRVVDASCNLVVTDWMPTQREAIDAAIAQQKGQP